MPQVGLLQLAVFSSQGASPGGVRRPVTDGPRGPDRGPPQRLCWWVPGLHPSCGNQAFLSFVSAVLSAGVQQASVSQLLLFWLGCLGSFVDSSRPRKPHNEVCCLEGAGK